MARYTARRHPIRLLRSTADIRSARPQGPTAGSIVLTNADPLVAVAPFPFMYRSSFETQRTAVAVGHSTQANDPTHGHLPN